MHAYFDDEKLGIYEIEQRSLPRSPPLRANRFDPYETA
jgi:hypothetical protein